MILDYLSPGITSTVENWIFFAPKILSLILSTNDPAAATRLWAGVLTLSNAFATESEGLSPVPVAEKDANQNTKIIAVIPKEDPIAILFLTCSGLLRKFSR